jgi:hypothetical protein
MTNDLELIRERYLKLVDNHNELQKQNSLLEDRILSIVESYSEEKSKFEHDLLDAKQQIVELTNTVNELEFEKQRYKNDCNLAIKLLHQHPNEFISKTLNQSQHTVIVPTFPPTFATALCINDNLRQVETIHPYPSKSFICSNCHKTVKYSDVSVQTTFDDGNIKRLSHGSILSSKSIPQMHHV